MGSYPVVLLINSGEIIQGKIRSHAMHVKNIYEKFVFSSYSSDFTLYTCSHDCLL